VTHEVEDVLDRLRAGTLAMSRQVTDLLLASVDTLRQLLSEARA
jgi:two-component system chemotaxis sensor kinase CheA